MREVQFDLFYDPRREAVSAEIARLQVLKAQDIEIAVRRGRATGRARLIVPGPRGGANAGWVRCEAEVPVKGPLHKWCRELARGLVRDYLARRGLGESE